MTEKTAYEKVFMTLAEFDGLMAEVKSDEDLSPQGKSKRAERLEVAKRVALAGLVTDLRRDAVHTVTRYVKAKNMLDYHQELDTSSMDFARLNYEAEAARSLLVVIGDDPFAMQEEFEKIKRGGNTYKLRAWMDVIPANVPKKSPLNNIWMELINDIKASKKEILSNETIAYRIEVDEKVNELARIEHAAIAIGDAFGGNMPTADMRQNVLKRVFHKIHVDSANGDISTEFTKLIFEEDNADKIFNQLEGEYEKLADLQKQVFDRFYPDGDHNYNPLLDGVAFDVDLEANGEVAKNGD